MRKFYISKRAGDSGIYKYSNDFYNLILEEKGYEFLNSAIPIESLLSMINKTDAVHIEIGIFLIEEIAILFTLIKKGYNNISVTLHDAPLVKFPLYNFKNDFLSKISKAYDMYVSRFSYQKNVLRKVRNIYVLTHKGAELMRTEYKLTNVYYLPHVVNSEEVKESDTDNCNIIYLGYIGKNKGLEYSLQLHQNLLKTFPAMKFYVVGKPLGVQGPFYEKLQKNFPLQTCFTGYVPEEKLNALFEDSTFSFLPFNQYKFYVPFSGSILYAMKKGKIVFTNDTNATKELVEDGKTGFHLSENLEQDTSRVTSIIKDRQLKQAVKHNVYNKLLNNYTSEAVASYYRD